MDFGVARVLRQRLGKILEIPVEIHIVLGHPAEVGKSVGINSMHQQHSHRLGPGIDDALLDQTNLATGAAEALIAVRAGAGDEKVLRIQVAETGHIGSKLFAIHSLGIGIDVALDGGAASAGSLEKLPACFRIARRKILRNSHGAPRKNIRLWRDGFLMTLLQGHRCVRTEHQTLDLRLFRQNRPIGDI